MVDTGALELFMNKEVKVYPGDTYRKTGVLKAIDDTGIVIEITSSQDKSYVVGKRYYISFSCKIVLAEL